MLTGRAYAVLGGGAALWVTGRLLGSTDLHMVALGLLALVALAWMLIRFSHPEIAAVRRLSSRRVFPGTAVRVDLEIRNVGRRRTPVLLVEDRIPRELGATGSAVIGEIRPGDRATAGYTMVARSRGRYAVGPLTVWVTDPFDLVRRRIEVDVQHDVLVYPDLVSLRRAPLAAPAGGAGDSSARQLFRSGEDFYTMRPYEQGDDLRRIHWPSVARSGELMIRQDESSRRASAAVFLDTRREAMTTPAFERAVAAAASIGAVHLRAGYRLRFATTDRSPAPVDLDTLLDQLAVIGQSPGRTLTPGLHRLARAVAGGGALVVVTHVPSAAEIAELGRVAPAAGSRLAVLVGEGSGGDVDAARHSLARSGWEVLILTEGASLEEAWERRRARTRATAGAWS